jgi:fructose-1,6-bisphosphatase/inositol monophosphatase family enzyme
VSKLPLSDAAIEDLACRTAVDAAVRAARRVLEIWPNPGNLAWDRSLANPVRGKAEGVGNYATWADEESERIILEEIRAHPAFGDHEIVSEEAGAVARGSTWQWVIDPIDGTAPFRNGAPEFGVCIGLLEHHVPVIGVIAMPAFDQIVVARRDHGAELFTLDGRLLADLRVPSDRNRSLDRALVGFDVGYEHRVEQLGTLVSSVAEHVGALVSYFSPATASFRLATGLLSAYFYAYPTIFDIAAAAAIIPEIGGIVSDLEGNPIDWSASRRSYLAARQPDVHHRLLGLINRREGGTGRLTDAP